MKIIFSLASLLIASAAASDDFPLRVKAGNDAIATPAGKDYDASLGSALQAAMPHCVPPGSSGHIGNFTVVGTVAASGSVSAIEVQPQTDTSRCFAMQIVGTTLPAPPFPNYPLTIEIRVTP